MKCARCKAEIRVGSMYCPVCGREAQIVSDDQLLEEEYLNNILMEETQSKGDDLTAQDKASIRNRQKSKQASMKKQPQYPSRRKKRILIWLFLMLAVAAIIIAFFVIRYRNNHSFGYQYNQGSLSAEKKNYNKALNYMKRALALDDTSLKARVRLGEIYQELDEPDKAEEVLLEAIELDDNYEDAYKLLITLYEKQKNYSAIVALQDRTARESIKELIDPYTSQPPVFVEEEGSYDEFISVSLKAFEDSKIYYTTDDSSPSEKGELYEKEIPLEEGETKIRAVAQNKYGIYSEEVIGRFKIELKKPDMPKVSPDSGSFNTKQTITIAVPEGSKAYYSWNGTAPDESSDQYIYPLQVPEGNNILSVVVINEYGLKSDVLKCNYIYLPSE